MKAQALSDQTLSRLIRGTAVTAGLAIAAIVALAFVGRSDGGSTLLERRIDEARAAVRNAPREVQPRLALAEVYHVANRPADALEQYDQVLKVQPAHKTALLGRGDILLAEDDLQGAATAYRKVIRTTRGGEFTPVDPDVEHAYFGLASVALAQGKAKEAISAAKAALKIERTDADAWYVLGAAHLKAGAPARAVDALRRAVLFVPTGWCEPYMTLSEAYTVLGRRAGAQYAQAMVDFCEGRQDAAAEKLRPLASGPVAVDAMLALGMLAEANGDREGALRWYGKVLAVDPTNFSARGARVRLGAAETESAPAHGSASS